jgi:hypothetical protein
MIKRKSIEYIKNISSKPLVGAEIGVYTGDNALNIFQNLNIRRLYLIDPYVMYVDYNSLDLPTALNDAKYEAFNLLSNYNPIWIYKKFNETTDTDFNNEKLDFIYIDGEHSEDMFRLDVIRAFMLINKNCGILCGHDAEFPSIKIVLKEMNDAGYKIDILENNKGNGFDWMIKL